MSTREQQASSSSGPGPQLAVLAIAGLAGLLGITFGQALIVIAAVALGVMTFASIIFGAAATARAGWIKGEELAASPLGRYDDADDDEDDEDWVADDEILSLDQVLEEVHVRLARWHRLPVEERLETVELLRIACDDDDEDDEVVPF
jgi:hypothetical protein